MGDTEAMGAQLAAAEPKIERKEIWLLRNRLGGLLLASEIDPARSDAVKVSLFEAEADALLNALPATAWLIRDSDGALLHRALKPVNDPRAIEVPAENAVLDEALKGDIVWMTKSGGAIVDLCDTYPLNPDAAAVARDDAEVVAVLAAGSARRNDEARRDAAWRRVRNRLIDEELAKE